MSAIIEGMEDGSINIIGGDLIEMLEVWEVLDPLKLELKKGRKLLNLQRVLVLNV